MKNFSSFLLILVILFDLSSCETVEPEPSKFEILTANTWKMTKVILDGEDVSNSSSGIMLLHLTFNSDGTYVETAGTFTNQGVWEFTDDENTIVLDKGLSDEESLEIIELKENFFAGTGYAYTPPKPIEFEMVYAE